MKYNVFSILCAIVAGSLAYNNKDGWGWFLFVALICFVIPDGSDDEEDEDDLEDENNEKKVS